MKFKNFLRVLLFISLYGNTMHAQNRAIEFDHSEWKLLLARAKQENKLIYLDCYTTWCGPCKWMAKFVYTNDTAADFYNGHFVNAKIDMEKGEGPDIAKKYGVRAFPTHLFVNGDGELIHRTCGSMPLADFITNGNNAINPEKQLVTFTKIFMSGNMDGASASAYFKMLQNGCQNFDTELASYFSSQKEAELTSPINWYIIQNYLENYSSPQFQYLENNKNEFAKLHTLDSVETKINQIYQQKLGAQKDKAEYETIQTKFRKTGNKNAEKIISGTNINFYVRTKEYDKYAAEAVSYMEKYGDLSPNMLNAVAWNFYEEIKDSALLEKAAGWAKKAIEINDNYPFNDTYASLLYKLGKKEQARIAAEKAIELAKKAGSDYKDTEALLKKINKL